MGDNILDYQVICLVYNKAVSVADEEFITWCRYNAPDHRLTILDYKILLQHFKITC